MKFCMVYLLLTFQTLDWNADESVSSERIKLKCLLHSVSNTELNIATVPNVYPAVHFVPGHVGPLSRDVRPTVTYRTVLYLLAVSRVWAEEVTKATRA